MSFKKEDEKEKVVDPHQNSQTLFLGGQRRGAIQKNRKSSSQAPDQDASESSTKESITNFLKANFFLKKKKVISMLEIFEDYLSFHLYKPL